MRDKGNQNAKKQMRAIKRLMETGEPFELIDGENLDFKGELIESMLEEARSHKIVVVCVIGP